MNEFRLEDWIRDIPDFPQRGILFKDITPLLQDSAATLLLSMGTHPKVVQELLGHSQISMTMDIYSHVMPTMQRDAMAKLNEVLKQKS